MSATHRLAEAAAAYGATVVNLRLPLILEQEGQPVAVILPFDEYERLRQSALSDQEHREAAWLKLESLLNVVRQRPSTLSSDQIEAEITLARDEVKAAHRGSSRSH